MDFFIASAYAQTAGAGASQPNQLIQMLPFVLLFVAMYFFIIRPQSKKAKEHREMIAKIAVGDEVVTAGGLLGRVTDLGDTFVSLEIAKGVEVRVQRFQVTQLMPKGTLKNA
jgi:preprotein translocase subunit YajC